MNKNLGFDSLNMLELFGIETQFNTENIILHIPHSSIYIPDFKGYNLTQQFNIDLQLLTDWATDKIFDIKNITKIIPQFSRLFCDVERFSDDDNEPMFKKGMGFFYTNSINGDVLRTDIDDVKDKIFNKYYLKHHNKLNKLTKEKLDTYGKAIIIDCHSFNNSPLDIDTDKNISRPDICLGTDDYHTPEYLLEPIKNYFINLGYNVQINSPFNGTMIPNDYYHENRNVQGIMIEINKKLYMENNEVNNEKVLILNKIITNLFNN
jgi:N-formylglutamate deformylase